MRIHEFLPVVLLVAGSVAMASDFAPETGHDARGLHDPDPAGFSDVDVAPTASFDDDLDMSEFDGWADEPSGENARPPTRTAPPDWLTAEPSRTRPANDLSGTWRGNGGERVEIRGEQARLWDLSGQMCTCYFMVFGDRLIAYSPETDVVRKFEFFRDRGLFALRDQYGQVMIFERAR